MSPSDKSIRIVEGVPAIRLRPAMYVGSTEAFGFSYYLLCPIALFLLLRPTCISVSHRGGGFQIESDVAVPIDTSTDGKLSPFEAPMKSAPGFGIVGEILNALSQSLSVEIQQGQERDALEYRYGTRVSHEVTKVDASCSHTTLNFVPDSTILNVTTISPAVLTSYLRRQSFFYPGVRFTYSNEAETQEFYSERGLVDLFMGVSAAYQLVHEPFHIVAEEGSTRLEAVFAYHCGRENIVSCFINNFRPFGGGTHEQGFLDALAQLVEKLEVPRDWEGFPNGVVGLLSLQYPEPVPFWPNNCGAYRWGRFRKSGKSQGLGPRQEGAEYGNVD
jgi:hypothetical protein